MKKPGGQDVPLMLTAILLPIISPKRQFLKWQIYTIFFQKAFRAAKGCSPFQLPLKDVLCPSESQELPSAHQCHALQASLCLGLGLLIFGSSTY